MRSDREEIPEGFTKEDADKAEIAEAEMLKRRTMQRTSAQAAATDCMTYWPEWRYQVCGAIRVKYDSLGGPNNFLLWPTSNEIRNPDNVGVRQTFTNGPIYWHPSAGAHPVVNHFFAAWQRNGWEGGKLGYPTSDEIVNPDNIGRRQTFQGGTIYWRVNEAYYVTGAIRDKWNQLGPLPAERSFLGYPISDEVVLPGGQGRMNRFENGVIYWSPTTGAHPVSGPILDQWSRAGYEGSSFGYPIADEVAVQGASSRQQFQNKWIHTPVAHVALGSTGKSLSFGVPFGSQLAASSTSDTVLLQGPGFDLRFKRYTGGAVNMGLTLNSAQAPSEFRMLLGLPPGFSWMNTPTGIIFTAPDGSKLASLSNLLAFDSQGNAVAVNLRLSP
ncbi:LGFP repeat-containing protein [Antrihabitans spumae]|uniref:LGFP repeat-containing protein n=1 Tax=Antrihabitans spumae TaxID=3373370 RepID=A0ABW7KBJ6_9NOCA